MQEGSVVVPAVVHEAVALSPRLSFPDQLEDVPRRGTVAWATNNVAVLGEAAAAVCEVAELLRLTKLPPIFTGQPRKALRYLLGGANSVWPVRVALFFAPEIVNT